jgi:hypothetical protein
MNESVQLPAELAAKLAAFERRLRRVEAGVAACAAVAGVLGTFAVLAFADRFVDTPPPVRALLTLLGGGGAAAAAVWWARHWLWRRRDVRELARLVQRRHRALGDRLLGAVELARDGADAAPGASPALIRAALRQVDAEARGCDFNRAAPLRAARRYGLAVAALIALLGAGLAWAPDAIRQSARRWLRPAASVPRYTLVSLTELPDELVVPVGEPFEIECGVRAGSRWIPATARARIPPRASVRAPVRGGRALFRFPGQLEPAPLHLRVGDERRSIRIRPSTRPELEALTAHIAWPAYLRRPDEARRIEQGRLTLPPGTRVGFEGRAGRALAAAALAGAEERPPEPAAVEAEHFHLDARPVETWIERHPGPAPGLARLAFEWTDTDGLAQARPYRLDLALGVDAPPTLEVEGLSGSVALLEEETVSLIVRAADDYGVRSIGLEWRIQPAETNLSERVGGRMLAEDDTGVELRLEGRGRISPRLLEAGPGSVIRLWVHATDHQPGRAPVRAGPYQIFVLSNEEHAQLLKQRMSELAARIEEAAREEERNLAQTGALESLDDEALEHARAAAALERAAQDERANAGAVRGLARDAEELAREGLRNPLLKAEDLMPWMRAAEGLSAAAVGPMSRAEQALAQAQARERERREPLDEARAEQQRALEALRGLARETASAMDASTARTFINRLREAARVERGIGELSVELMPALLGLPPEEIEPAPRARIAGAQVDHTHARTETGHVRDDLGAFFARTRMPLYDEIRAEMIEPDVLDAFDAVHALVERNHLVDLAGRAAGLAERLEAWAQRIEDAAGGDESGGGGEGGGEGEGIEPEVLLGLMRARVTEEMLREQTRAAEQERTTAAYEPTVRRAAQRQARLTEELAELAGLTNHAEASQFLWQLSGWSGEAAGLLARPETGADTVGIQTVIIEAIAASLQSRPGGGQGGTPSEGPPGEGEGEGEGEGRTGGGSTAGGTSVGVGPHTGPGGGAEGEGAVERGGGADPATWPEEYRDAIRRYYETVEDGP